MRVQIIEETKTEWYIAQSLIVLSVLLTTAGFFVLNTQLYRVTNAWVPTLGASAFIFGAISATIFLYRQTTDPPRCLWRHLLGHGISILLACFNWSTALWHRLFAGWPASMAWIFDHWCNSFIQYCFLPSQWRSLSHPRSCIPSQPSDRYLFS